MEAMAAASLSSFPQRSFVALAPLPTSPLLKPTASVKDDQLSPSSAHLALSPARNGNAATFAVNALELRYGSGASSETRRRGFLRARAIADGTNVPPVKSADPTDQEPDLAFYAELEAEDLPSKNVSGFSDDTPYTLDLSAMAAVGGGSGGNEVQLLAATNASYQPRVVWFAKSAEEENQYLDRAINATIAGAAGAFTITKILTVDHDYWHGWTIFEILRYAPLHNWSAYEEALQNNPILAKMMISGVVYSLGDWIAQCYEGKPILDFNRTRMFRSGLVGFCLHGSLSHFYYHLCEALFPFKDWWVVPLKVAFDQTLWSAFWNSVYFVVLGLLRLESPANILLELRATFWPLLTAGWKLWPFAHLITYGVIPVEQRLLWVDCVELAWVTILSMYSNEKAEARILEAANEAALELQVTSLESEGESSEVQ